VDKRLTALSAKGDPLEAIDRLVPWESFRADIEMVALTPDEARKSHAGRKPFDAILMLRMLVLQSLYNLGTSRLSIRCATGCRSRGFSGLGSRTAFPTARRYGCSASSSRRRA
jgi:transposase, IS5 family